MTNDNIKNHNHNEAKNRLEAPGWTVIERVNFERVYVCVKFKINIELKYTGYGARCNMDWSCSVCLGAGELFWHALEKGRGETATVHLGT